jgi:hypothetical protein
MEKSDLRELHRRLYEQRRDAIREKRPAEYVNGLGAAIVTLMKLNGERHPNGEREAADAWRGGAEAMRAKAAQFCSDAAGDDLAGAIRAIPVDTVAT